MIVQREWILEVALLVILGSVALLFTKGML